MEAAGRDRRASPKVAPKVEFKESCQSKKRQPGARQESSEKKELPSSSRQDSEMEGYFKNKIEKERKQPNIPDASESAQADSAS